MGFFSKIFKSYSEKEVKRVMPIVEKINSLEEEQSFATTMTKKDYIVVAIITFILPLFNPTRCFAIDRPIPELFFTSVVFIK